MPPLLQLPLTHRLLRLRPQRVVAIDPGLHALKVLALESFLGRIRVLRQEHVILREEGLLSADDLAVHLQSLLAEFDDASVALALPQHLALTQVIDLPRESGLQVRKLIEEQTVKLSGLSESAIVYDFARLKPYGKHPYPFWITLSQEAEILAQLRRLALADQHVCEITTTANALISAFASLHPEARPSILVDLGAMNTVVVVMLEGQGVFAFSFPLGSDAFTDSIAAEKTCETEEAAGLKRSQNLFSTPGACPALVLVVDQWRQELERALHEWQEDHPEYASATSRFDVCLCGGGSLQPGLVEYLDQRGPWRVRPWPSSANPNTPAPTPEFMVAYGTALQALGRTPQSASLLPASLRQISQRHRWSHYVQQAALVSVMLFAVVLLAAIWQKFSLLNQKSAWLVETRTALAQAELTEVLTAQLMQEYEALRPVFERQKKTSDALQTLSLLQQVRSNQTYWYVLFADQQSYLSSQLPGQTNPPSRPTNEWIFPEFTLRTNPPSPRPGFIAELCLPAEGEAMRLALSQLVTNLRKAPLIRNVDTLASDRRKNLVDPKVLIPDRHIALTIELAENGLAGSLPFGGQLLLATNRYARPGPRTFKQRVESIP